MSIEIWPFLVSRNTYLDYRTVVAPDFICDAKIANLLAVVAEGDLTKPNEVIIREIVSSKVDDFTIVFQVGIAKEKDIDPEGSNKELVDQFGRKIYLFKGVVIKGIGENYLYVSDKDIERGYEQSIVAYREFWNWNDIKPSRVTKSSKFDIETNTSSQVLTHERKRRFHANIQDKSLSKKSCELKPKFEKEFTEGIASIVFSPDDSSIAVQNKFLETLIWNFSSNKSSSSYDVSPQKIKSTLPIFGNDRSVCFSPDGLFIAFVIIKVPDKNLIELYDLQSRKKNKVFQGHKCSEDGRIKSIAFDPNGTFIASASQDKTVKIWDVLNEKEADIKSLPHNNPVTAIAISHDGCRLASGDDCGNIKVWDLKTYKEKSQIMTTLSLVKSIAFSPNDKILAAGGETKENFVDASYIRLWYLSKESIQEIPISNKDSHGDVVNSVAFSPDGKILASAGKDKKIVFWDVNSTTKICPLSFPKESAHHDDEITSITFNSKGDYLASGGKDKKVKIWSF